MLSMSRAPKALRRWCEMSNEDNVEHCNICSRDVPYLDTVDGACSLCWGMAQYEDEYSAPDFSFILDDLNFKEVNKC